MSSDFAIRLTGVTKRFEIYALPGHRLKQFFAPPLRGALGLRPKQYYSEFVAVNNVSFQVGRGETVGIIGRNGSGKSTLLQMICGTLTPSSGQIEVNGRIAALLELGAGFNPEFTGRQNVMLNAAILGLTQKEVLERFDSIEKFADIGAFIDRPVKTYSSGMYVRLAFAVAINVDPDILIVDEALSVGDEAFQRKCFARIEEIRQNGSTILFVSHGAQTLVQLCDRAILLDSGERLLEGRPKFVVNEYQRLVNLAPEKLAEGRERIKALAIAPHPEEAAAALHAEADQEPDAPKAPANLAWFDPNFRTVSEVSYEPQGAVIDAVKLSTLEGQIVNNVANHTRYALSYRVAFDDDADAVSFAMLVKTVSGMEIGGQSSHMIGKGLAFKRGETAEVRFEFDCNLMPGVYLLNCGAYSHANGSFRQLHRILDALIFRVMPGGNEQKRIGIVDMSPDGDSFSLERNSDTRKPSVREIQVLRTAI